jgi:hypothetical protein
MNDQPIRGGAVLYTVQGPRGSYFAVHDPATGRICTESSDPRARAQAREMGLLVTHEETISHQELLRRTGRDADVAGQVMKTNPASASNEESQPGDGRGSAGDGLGASETVLPPRAASFLDDTAESLIVRHAHGRGAVFSTRPLEPEPRYSELSDDSGLWRNMPVLNPPEEDWTAPERQG